MFIGSNYPKNKLFNFEKNFTGREWTCVARRCAAPVQPFQRKNRMLHPEGYSLLLCFFKYIHVIKVSKNAFDLMYETVNQPDHLMSGARVTQSTRSSPKKSCLGKYRGAIIPFFWAFQVRFFSLAGVIQLPPRWPHKEHNAEEVIARVSRYRRCFCIRQSR